MFFSVSRYNNQTLGGQVLANASPEWRLELKRGMDVTLEAEPQRKSSEAVPRFIGCILICMYALKAGEPLLAALALAQTHRAPLFRAPFYCPVLSCFCFKNVKPFILKAFQASTEIAAIVGEFSCISHPDFLNVNFLFNTYS